MVNSVVPEASDPNYEYPLAFFSNEVQRLRRPHDDAFVISLKVENLLLQQILVDTGSLTNIIFFSALKK